MHKDINGIILSGGRSRRMGQNKSLMKLGGKYVIEIISDLMKQIFNKVILITNEPHLYHFLNLETYRDIYKEKGPLGGIHSGLWYSNTENNFIISCDIPLVTKEIIQFITDYPSDKLIRIPLADGFKQHLCGVYSDKCIPLIENILNGSVSSSDKKKCMVTELIKLAGGEIIDIEKEMSGCKLGQFMNMNNIFEFEKIKNILEKEKEQAV